MNMGIARKTDNLSDTLDYREIIRDVKNIVSTCQFNLVERLVEELISSILEFSDI
jgi:7,8-dihydroneopterin aldolase/epimerase/oxygenase